ncbi:MAG: hypothetical protein FJ302_15550 [Planctomycetes bacterium]|nr:hypothetical protein [Planctomycetota bacterium]
MHEVFLLDIDIDVADVISVEEVVGQIASSQRPQMPSSASESFSGSYTSRAGIDNRHASAINSRRTDSSLCGSHTQIQRRLM